MVTEFMLQQTPVARVLPVHEQWLARWPTPGRPGRRADRRGGPRLGPARLPAPRAAAARGRRRDRRAARRRGAGVVRRPARAARRRRLHRRGDRDASPTAGATSCSTPTSAGCSRRAVAGRGVPGAVGRPGPSARPRLDGAARRRADRGDLVGRRRWSSARWSARRANPRCAACPVADLCAWRAAGYPAYDGPPRKVQTWAGTDRQCRGRLLAVLRDSDGPVHRSRLDAAWREEEQRDRCLAGLVEDGLVVARRPGHLRAALKSPSRRSPR